LNLLMLQWNDWLSVVREDGYLYFCGIVKVLDRYSW
jgi:hypothetical protein